MDVSGLEEEEAAEAAEERRESSPSSFSRLAERRRIRWNSLSTNTRTGVHLSNRKVGAA